MTEYISREAAITAIGNPKVTPGGMIFDALKFACQEEVRSLPAADVAPVVHAKWVLTTTRTSIDFPEDYTWNCSHCGYRRKHGSKYTDDARKPKGLYCERCGAKMDGGTKDDKKEENA